MAGVLIGLVAGVMGGLVGVGGGVVMIPLMTELLRMRQQTAHGTSLVAVVFTAVVGALVYYLHGSADIPASLLLAALSLATVRLGTKYCCVLPEWKLKRQFGFFLLCVALLLFFKPFLPAVAAGTLPEWARWSFLALLGALTGFIAGMMGVGGGIFMVPMMVLVIGVSQHMAQGISLLAMIPASASGAWAHAKAGNTKKELLPGLIVGVLAGAYGGGEIAHLLPDRQLRLVFVLLLLYTATRYLRAKPRAGEVCTPEAGSGRP